MAAWPLAARAQQVERMRRVGVLMSLAETDAEAQARVAAFRKELQTLGWAEGRNVRIDIRWAASDAALMQRFAKELIALQQDLILSHNTPTTASLLQQTRTIPIVFVIVSDPVGSGFVASFPRPGGNITGFTNIEPTLAGKWLELRLVIGVLACLRIERGWRASAIADPLFICEAGYIARTIAFLPLQSSLMSRHTSGRTTSMGADHAQSNEGKNCFRCDILHIRSPSSNLRSDLEG